MNMQAAGIRIEGVTKRFSHLVKGEVHAARDVSLEVAPGQFVTLLGPSGCGKTTTLRMVAGFETPDAGRISIGGEDVTSLPVNRREIGFVFQNYALFPHLAVFENVAYGLRVRGRSGDALGREVGEVLALVGLGGHERQYPHQLSGGEQQRVALARAIVIRPRVLLFDEPLSNLDAKLRVQMRSEIRELQKRLAITTVYVTHDQEEAMAVSDRIAVMNRGTIVQQGSAEDLYLRPASEFVAQFIGRVNLVAARVISVAADGAGSAQIEVLGQRCEVQARGLQPGKTAKAVLRPEAIALADAGAAGARATVVSRTYLGEKVEYAIDCQGERLLVTRQGGAYAAGDPVSLVLPQQGIAVLP